MYLIRWEKIKWHWVEQIKPLKRFQHWAVIPKILINSHYYNFHRIKKKGWTFTRRMLYQFKNSFKYKNTFGNSLSYARTCLTQSSLFIHFTELHHGRDLTQEEKINKISNLSRHSCFFSYLNYNSWEQEPFFTDLLKKSAKNQAIRKMLYYAFQKIRTGVFPDI